jgi:RNA polymerase primary sigma factor
MRRLKLPRRKAKVLEQAVRAHNPVVPLDRLGTNRSFTEVLLDPRADPPEAPLLQDEDLHRFRGLLATLGPREAAVLRMRFGLGGEPPLTLQEAGERLGLTRERVRQIEKKVLHDLGELMITEGRPEILDAASPSEAYRPTGERSS